jgi:hypothetical protein
VSVSVIITGAADFGCGMRRRPSSLGGSVYFATDGRTDGRILFIFWVGSWPA